MSRTRFVAVAHVPGAAGPRFCGHIHRRRDLANRCKVLFERRLRNAVCEVAEAWDAEVDPCVLLDYHRAGVPCPACGQEGTR